MYAHCNEYVLNRLVEAYKERVESINRESITPEIRDRLGWDADLYCKEYKLNISDVADILIGCDNDADRLKELNRLIYMRQLIELGDKFYSYVRDLIGGLQLSTNSLEFICIQDELYIRTDDIISMQFEFNVSEPSITITVRSNVPELRGGSTFTCVGVFAKAVAAVLGKYDWFNEIAKEHYAPFALRSIRELNPNASTYHIR